MFKESADLDEDWRLHKYHIWCFGQDCSKLGHGGCASKANKAMLGYSVARK